MSDNFQDAVNGVNKTIKAGGGTVKLPKGAYYGFIESVKPSAKEVEEAINDKTMKKLEEIGPGITIEVSFNIHSPKTFKGEIYSKRWKIIHHYQNENRYKPVHPSIQNLVGNLRKLGVSVSDLVDMTFQLEKLIGKPIGFDLAYNGKFPEITSMFLVDSFPEEGPPEPDVSSDELPDDIPF